MSCRRQKWQGYRPGVEIFDTRSKVGNYIRGLNSRIVSKVYKITWTCSKKSGGYDEHEAREEIASIIESGLQMAKKFNMAYKVNCIEREEDFGPVPIQSFVFTFSFIYSRIGSQQDVKLFTPVFKLFVSIYQMENPVTKKEPFEEKP